MGNRQRSRSADDDFNSCLVDIEIPFRSTLLTSYRFETPVWKNDELLALFKVFHLKSRIYLVMKKLKINSENTSLMYKELSLSFFIDHPNIIKIYDHFQTSTHYYINYHYFDAPSLIDYYINMSGKIDLGQIKYIIRTIFEILTYLHKNNIILRNFDPTNILYNGKQLFLVGLGKGMFRSSKSSKKKRLLFQHNYALPIYKAPEVINKAYDEKAEVWVVGILLHLFLTGELPFKNTNQDKLYDAIVNQPLDDSIFVKNELSEEAINLIKKLLEKDPEKRISAAEALTDPFLTSIEKEVQPRNLREAFKKVKNLTAELDFSDEMAKFIIRKSFQNNQFEYLKALFRKLDQNKDGVITKEEFLMTAESINFVIPITDVDVIFKKFDINKTGTLECDEFIMALSDRHKLLNDEKFGEYFDFICQETINKVSYDQIEKIIGNSFDKAQLKPIYNKYSGRDRNLNRKEFIAFMNEFISLLEIHRKKSLKKN